MSRNKTVALVALVLALVGCGYLDKVLSPTQDSTQTVIINPAPVASATPTPAPGSSGLVAPAYVRVSFFGGSCPSGSGKTFPSNGLGQVPVSCTGFATATPKNADGTDQTPAQHGPNIAWAVESGASLIDVQSVAETFNRDVKGLAPGSFSLCATVQGVKGCLDGQVTP